MKKNLIISPVGLKGKEIHERQLALMGIKPITENEEKKNSAVELTKIGPDGNAYAIIRENHEYYIKKTSKTTGLVLEDFGYIGGLQNKKNEAYPSYAKAIKQLNLKFKSLAEAYNRGNDINVFEDDNLLEHHPLKADMKLSATKGIGDNQEYVVDKSGTPLSNKAKEGKAEGQFGDNVADKDVDDEFEKVKVNESGMHGFSEMRGNGFSGHGNLNGNIPMQEYDEKAMQNFIDQYGEEKGKQIYYATANKEDRDPETFKKNEGMTSLGDEVELNEYEQAIEEMMARMEGEEFPDLTGDGEVTRADILKGRGVFEEDSNDKIELTPLYTKRDSKGFRFYSANNGTVLYAEKNGVIYNVNDDLKVTGKASIAWQKDDRFVGLVDDKDTSNLEPNYYEKQTIDRVKNSFGELEESIKRLDALLEGELKKKAQTLTKKK